MSFPLLHLPLRCAQHAACHPKTKGKELAVVLRDPVGVATELNALRLRRHELAQQDIKAESEKPDNQWALNSSDALLSLKDLYARVEYARALDRFAPVVSLGEYRNPKPTNPFFGATTAPLRYDKGSWEAIEGHARNDYALGRVWHPESEARITAQAAKELAAAWKKIESEYNEAARQDWITKFHDRMKQDHMAPVARFEQD